MFPLLYTGLSLVLYNDENPVGYLYAACNKKKAFVHTIAVIPSDYRKGYGTMMLKNLEEKCRRQGLKSIWCYMLPENQFSRAFFVQNGFIMQKQIRISTDEERVLYRKKL